MSSHQEFRDYPIQPVPFTQVQVADDFWSPRIETNRVETIPFAFGQCEDNGRMDNFDRAAAVLRGETISNSKISGFSFDDTDPYKVIEGASYSMAVTTDAELDAYIDSLIVRIAAAQEPDGYLYTSRTINPQRPHEWAGSERWVLERELSHELYNFGHLYEAAVAHYQATGKRSLLDIAIKTADLLDRTFGPNKQAIWPGHQITEMGLVKLYRVTGEERYLQLAKFLLDVRGPDGQQGSGKQYNQSHQPVVEQTEAVGHAVRAVYMYAGMADVAAITGDESYLKAIDAIWENVVTKKLYITGGIGSTAHGEAFGKNYELPNMTAYCETCAAIANVYWNHRLFLLHGDSKYIDVLERTLYNGLISGVSLDGKGFFYPNPLESKGQHARQPWFGCACCPSNICRFMASIPAYVYAQRKDEIFVNLFASGSAQLQLGSKRKIELVQETNYPWDGAVKMVVNPEEASEFALNMRIPAWARNKPVPSDLYGYLNAAQQLITLKVNGEDMPLDLKSGYISLRRFWQAGDSIELNLPMPARRVTAHEKVEANRGRVAFERGPLVYCFEWPDNPNGKVRNLLVPDNAELTTETRPNLLGDIVTLKTNGLAFSLDDQGQHIANEVQLTAIPYYAWAHRGQGEMAVWIARDEAVVRPALSKTIASTAKITAFPNGNHLESIRDNISASIQGEERGSAFFWWPRPAEGTAAIEYAFVEPEQLCESAVYWFDDTDRGGCRVPQSWRLFYKDTSAGNSGAWRPVMLESGAVYSSAKDRFNNVRFQPVTTTGLRLEVKFQEGWSGGVEEWSVK